MLDFLESVADAGSLMLLSINGLPTHPLMDNLLLLAVTMRTSSNLLTGILLRVFPRGKLMDKLPLPLAVTMRTSSNLLTGILLHVFPSGKLMDGPAGLLVPVPLTDPYLLA
ncbi:MAG: hypothetical protein LAQ69_46605 [Acidobacteriia bacterium]|nr:hypothetical protein [Terriglobia bacterium]